MTLLSDAELHACRAHGTVDALKVRLRLSRVGDGDGDSTRARLLQGRPRHRWPLEGPPVTDSAHGPSPGGALYAVAARGGGGVTRAGEAAR